MTQIEYLTPSFAQLHSDDEDAIRCAADFLTIESPSARFSKAVRFGNWDGMVRLLRRPSNMFPAGLTPLVAARLRKEGFQVTIKQWKRNDLPLVGAPPKLLGPEEDRDYQISAVNIAIRDRRVELECPTGGGKTRIGADIIRCLGGPVLWMVNTKTLLDQTAMELHRMLGQKVTIVALGGGSKLSVQQILWHLQKGAVIVATVQTLSRLQLGIQGWAMFKTLIVDEAHHASAETWLKVADKLAGAWNRIGLSGTLDVKIPLLRSMRSIGALGPTFKVTTTTALADQGFLARPTIIMNAIPRQDFLTYPQVREAVLPDWRRDPRRLSKMGGELFRFAYEAGIIENGSRNAKISALAKHHSALGEKVLILCSRIPHGQALFALLSRDLPRVPVAWISGQERDDVRRETLAQFVTEGRRVLIASTILQEGVDLPAIDTLILAGGGQSEIATIQRVGRSLRIRPDKNTVLIHDFLDGRYPFEEKDYLAQHTLERLRTYRRQGFAIDGMPEDMLQYLDEELRDHGPSETAL